MFQSRKSKNIVINIGDDVINIGDDVINIGCDWVRQQKNGASVWKNYFWVKF